MPIRCITRRSQGFEGIWGAGRTGRMAGSGAAGSMAAGRRAQAAEVSISSGTATTHKGLAGATGDLAETALADTLREGLEDLVAEGTRRPRRATSVGEAGILVEAADTPVEGTPVEDIPGAAIRAVAAATVITTKPHQRRS